MSAPSRLVYKILARSTWDAAVIEGTYTGSPDDQRDGFIHFSAADQVVGTLAKHFAGQEDLVVVSFAAASLGSALRWEASRGGALFPHLYGALETSLSVSVFSADELPELSDLAPV